MQPLAFNMMKGCTARQDRCPVSTLNNNLAMTVTGYHMHLMSVIADMTTTAHITYNTISHVHTVCRLCENCEEKLPI